MMLTKPKTALPRNFETVRLLLVEDNAGDAELTRERLSTIAGYSLDMECVTNLKDAIDTLEQSYADAVLLDLSLPDSQGIETLRRLRRACHDVAIVVFSGDETSEDLRRLAIREGAQDFIGKSESLAPMLGRILPSALERHRAQEPQREAEELLKLTPDAVIVTDAAGVVQFANEAAVALFARPEGALVGRPIPIPIPIDQDGTSEFEIQCSDMTRIAEFRVAECSWGHQPARLVSIRDTTQRRSLETARHESERRLAGTLQELQAVLDSAVDGVVIFDAAGRICRFTPAAQQIFGYQVDEAIGRNIMALIPDLSQDQYGGFVDGYFNLGPPESMVTERELTARRQDGTTFPIGIGISAYRLETETRFVAIVRNITTRKLARAALKASEETFRSAMDAASIGMALVDPDGRWLKVNRALCKILGYSAEELVANDTKSITHPEDQLLEQRHAAQLLGREVDNYQLEKRLYHRSGRTVWTLTSTSLVKDIDDAPLFFVVQIQDITEQKSTERLKSDFISTVSHELRTPLTSIRGSLGLITNAMAGQIPEKANRLIHIAHNNCERLILLINDILDLDKIAAGEMRFDMRVESLAELIGQAVEANRDFAAPLGVSLLVTALDTSARVTVDASRFLQVISNLLSNAAKFSPRDSQVEIFTTVLDRTVRTSVRDHGKGIPEPFQGRIFSKFSQADSSANRAQAGTGLGLHISKLIVERMAGTIGYDTELGVGTTFWVELPLVALAGDEHDGVHAVLRNVLVCEPESPAAPAMAMVLQEARYGLAVARSFENACQRLRNDDFEAIVMDADLLTSSDIKLVDELQACASATDLPIIIASANPDRDRAAVACLSSANVSWLRKPIVGTLLADTVRQTIECTRARAAVLHVEDNRDLTKFLGSALDGKVKIISAPTLKEARKLLAERRFQLVILDDELSDGSGLDLLTDLHPIGGVSTPVMILSANEVPKAVFGQVTASVVKARASETKLVELISELIERSPVEVTG